MRRLAKRTISCVVAVALLFSGVVFEKGTVQGSKKPTKLAEVVEKANGESDKDTEEYVVMAPLANGDELGDNVATVEMTEDTAEELNETYDDVIIEENILLSASTKDKKAERRALYEQWEKEEAEREEVKKEKRTEPEWCVEAINADGLDEEVKDSQKVKVAVLDSGVDIVQGIDLAGTVNLVPEEKEISPMFLDLTGHGTGIASIIAGTDEGGVQGVNPNVDLYSVKVLDEENKAPLSRVIEGIYWCIENDINIINMSFGTSQYSRALEKAVQDAYNANILIVGAAGNDGGEVEYPAAFDEVMAVAATNTQSEIADFSNDGEEVEVAAPGEKVKATGFFGGTIVTHGTSIAVPFVTGVASLLWEKDLGKSNDFIRDLINCSERSIEGAGECGLVDAGYALEIYDEFAANYASKQTDKEEFKNEEPVDTFEFIKDDEAYVEGRWVCDETTYQGHPTTVAVGANFAGITDQNVINIVKAGAVYPDKPASGITGGAYPEFHGGWYRGSGASKVYINYISCYELLTRLALNGGSGSGVSSYTDIWGINSQTYNRIVSVVSASQVGSRSFDALLSECGVINDATNRKYFLWGCAMHMLGDTFAHSTKKRNAATGAIGSDISEAGGADNPTVVPNRYQTAKMLVAYGMRCLSNNTHGDYFQFYQALKYAPHDGTWAKKKLLTYAEDNGYGLKSGERPYFEKASASD